MSLRLTVVILLLSFAFSECEAKRWRKNSWTKKIKSHWSNIKDNWNSWSNWGDSDSDDSSTWSGWNSWTSWGSWTSWSGSGPTSGGNNPASGGNNPAIGGNAPTSGGNNPTSGGNNPASGGNTPTSGGNAPTSGGNNPASGGNTPTSGGTNPTSNEASGEKLPDNVVKSFIDAHNAARATVNSPPLTWNESLEVFAQTKTPASECKFQHTRPNSYGENLYAAFPISSDNVQVAKDSVASWADEVENYDAASLRTDWLSLCFPDNPPPGHRQCGHYTQLMWSKTTQVGCSINNCPGNQQIVVCDYYPEGNIDGENAY